MNTVALPGHASLLIKIWHYMFIFICALVFLFLIAPILVVIPLSFNAEPYFTFNENMLALKPEAYSTRWYEDFWSKDIWRTSIGNSLPSPQRSWRPVSVPWARLASAGRKCPTRDWSWGC